MNANARRGLLVFVLVVLFLLSCTVLVSIVIQTAIRRALDERNTIGFVVSPGGVSYRTPNSELLAPAWNEPVVVADPKSFKTILHTAEFDLGMDAKTVYMGQGRRVYQLAGSDPKTFRPLTPDGRFACDAKNVYFLGFQLPGADPNSFQILGRFTSKDANQVYLGSTVLTSADPRTFRIEQEGTLPDLSPQYSGPCTGLQFTADWISFDEFVGQDQNMRFRGRTGRRKL